MGNAVFDLVCTQLEPFLGEFGDLSAKPKRTLTEVRGWSKKTIPLNSGCSFNHLEHSQFRKNITPPVSEVIFFQGNVIVGTFGAFK